MSLIYILLIIIIVGLLLWLVNTKLPMEPTIKTILNFVVVIALVIWILKATGLLHGFETTHL